MWPHLPGLGEDQSTNLQLSNDCGRPGEVYQQADKSYCILTWTPGSWTPPWIVHWFPYCQSYSAAHKVSIVRDNVHIYLVQCQTDKLNLDRLIDWMGTVDFFFGRIKETELDDTRYHELTAEQGWSLKMGSPPYTLLCGKNLPRCGDFTCTSSCPVARGEVRWETPNWSLE